MSSSPFCWVLGRKEWRFLPTAPDLLLIHIYIGTEPRDQVGLVYYEVANPDAPTVVQNQELQSALAEGRVDYAAYDTAVVEVAAMLFRWRHNRRHRVADCIGNEARLEELMRNGAGGGSGPSTHSGSNRYGDRGGGHGELGLRDLGGRVLTL